MRTPRILPIGLALAATTAFAQERPPLPELPDQKAIASKAFEFQLAEEMDSALAWYRQVDPNDSLHAFSLFQQSVILYGKEDYDGSLKLVKEGWELNSGMKAAFGKNIALCTAMKKDYAGAHAWIDKMILEFPGNSEVRYTKGLIHEEEKKWAEAIAVYQDVARRNPFYPSSHRRLSSMAVNEGKLTQAALSLFFSIIVKSGDETSNRYLAWGNEFLSGTVELEPKGISIDKNEDFADIDLLVQNRVALDKKYKAVPNIPLHFARQLHLIVEQLAQLPDQQGFWSTYYVPVFLKYREEGLWEGMVYHLLSNSTGDDHLKMVKKNQAKVDLFRARAARVVEDLHATWPDSIGGTVKPVMHFFDNDQNLWAVGTLSSDRSKLVGDGRFFHDNGRVSSFGRLDDNGLKQGEWRFHHPNGRLKIRQSYVDDKIEGRFWEYYDNGALEDSGTVKSENLDGIMDDFKRNGARWRRRSFTPDGANGEMLIYHDNGATAYTVNLVNGQETGTITGYAEDGKKDFEGTYTDGKKTGTHTNYDREGKEVNKYVYTEGEPNGPFTTWHPNGKVEREGQMIKGRNTGTVKTWAVDGTLISEINYDDRGKWHGTYREYDTDGKPHTEQEWNHGVLMKYRYFDKSGAVMHEASRQKGAFDFKGYTPDGALNLEGRYLASEGKEGEWKYYWADGTLRSTEQYEEASQTGVEQQFYSDGPLRYEQLFSDDAETGGYRYYYGNGQLSEEGFKKDGELHGIRRNYRVNGSLSSVYSYLDGELHGWGETYDPDGKLIKRVKYEFGWYAAIELYNEKGERYQRFDIGPGRVKVLETFPDGSKSMEHNFMNGVDDGPFKRWYPNGKLSIEGNYVNGKEHGTWKYWYTNGKVSKEVTFDLGERHGMEKEWYDNGKPEMELGWHHGLRHGERVWYYENGLVLSRVPFLYGDEHGEGRYYNDKGDLELVRYYRMGQLYGYSYEGADGKLLPMVPIVGGTAHLVAKYRNGQVSRDMGYRNGSAQGTFLEYYPDGKLIEKVEYVHDDETGLNEEFHANGQLADRYTYIDGVRDGEYERRWENGKVREKGAYAGGDLHGAVTLYDNTGKAIEKRIYRDGDIIRFEKP